MLEQGLKGLPLNEPIYRARMHVEAAAANPDRLREAYSVLTRELSQIGCDGGFEPDAETTRTFKRLLAAVGSIPAAS